MSFSDKKLIFAGAGAPGRGTPWQTLGIVTQRALAPFGYELHNEGAAWGPANPRYVGDKKADLGATQLASVRWAYEGSHRYKSDGPRPSLRAIACINFPSWLAVAVRWETMITDLSQIKERKLPVRVLGGRDDWSQMVWEYYGLSREMIESWGGKFLEVVNYPGMNPVWDSWARNGEFEVIMENIYAANAPENKNFMEATILWNLRFLPLPDDLIQSIRKEIGGEPGAIPHLLLRGVQGDVPSVLREPQCIYARDDTPDDFVYLLAKALDDNRHLFRHTHIPYSLDPKNVAKATGVPLHPAAERYYREMGYPLR